MSTLDNNFGTILWYHCGDITTMLYFDYIPTFVPVLLNNIVVIDTMLVYCAGTTMREVHATP